MAYSKKTKPTKPIMKASKISLIAAVVAGVMLAHSPALCAQDTNASKDTQTRQGRPGRGGAGMKEHMDKVAKELNLTTEQKTKYEAAMKEQGEKRRGMRDLSPDERREKGKALREEVTKKMKEILTAEQFEKWQKSRTQGWPGSPGGQGHGPRKGGEDKK